MKRNDLVWKIFFTDYSIQLPVPAQVDLIRFTPLPCLKAMLSLKSFSGSVTLPVLQPISLFCLPM